MPLPKTWKVIRSLARLTGRELRCLELRCLGYTHERIAEQLVLSVAEVTGEIARGQLKCQRSRPWHRWPRPHEWHEDLGAVAEYWREAKALADADRLDDLGPYCPPPRDLDEDLLADARFILARLANREMRKRPPASGGDPPGAYLGAEELRDYWLDVLTGGEMDGAQGDAPTAAHLMRRLAAMRGIDYE